MYMWACRCSTPHVWLGSIHPRSQCAGGMLLVQWCYKHVLNCLITSPVAAAACLSNEREVERVGVWSARQQPLTVRD